MKHPLVAGQRVRVITPLMAAPGRIDTYGVVVNHSDDLYLVETDVVPEGWTADEMVFHEDYVHAVREDGKVLCVEWDGTETWQLPGVMDMVAGSLHRGR
jgi:hypothetical protein